MTKYFCIICGQIVDDKYIEVSHYGADGSSACAPCVDELYGLRYD